MNMTAPVDARVWIIGDRPALLTRLQASLSGPCDSEENALLSPAAISRMDLFTEHPGHLELVILEVDDPPECGLEIIQRLRKARIRAPVVVLTRDFSRQFGAKILSQGVRYYFPHDYCETEFQEVVQSLLGHGQGDGSEKAAPNQQKG